MRLVDGAIMGLAVIGATLASATQGEPIGEISASASNGISLVQRYSVSIRECISNDVAVMASIRDFGETAFTSAVALAAVRYWAPRFGASDAAQEFRVMRSSLDPERRSHVRLSQWHQGVRVEGGELIVHFEADGRPYQMNGRYVPAIRGDVRPTLTAKQAEGLARADLAARTDTASYPLRASTEIVMYAVNSDPILAYHVELTHPQGLVAWRYWIDAHEGRVLNHFTNIRQATIAGYLLSGEGGGSAAVTGAQSGASYLLTNSAWYVFNNDTENKYSDSGQVYARLYDNWTTERTDSVGLSAAYNVNMALWYWASRHGRASFDNANTIIRVNVFDNRTSNVYWFYSIITFPSGGDFMVLDIMSHELGHGVNNALCNFWYQNESGALDESFADIWGASTEFFAQSDGRPSYPSTAPGQADWLLGEDSSIGSYIFCDMRNPNRVGHPSRYGGANWHNYLTNSYDNGGVHINSGVQNFMFYLLTEGGMGNNDGLPYAVNGIGLSAAEKIGYRALNYLTANPTYADAYPAWISAAQDLNPAWTVAVHAAWAAVGVAVYPPLTLSVGVNLSNASWRLTQYPAGYVTPMDGTGNLSAISAPEGTYAVSFGDVVGYRTPSPQTNTVSSSAGALMVGSYEAAQGTLTVGTSPTTGVWRLTQAPTLYAGAMTGTGIMSTVTAPTGTYVIAFDPMMRFRTPVGQTNTLLDHGTLVFTGLYTRIQASGDFDADGYVDFAMYQKTSGLWAIILSGKGYDRSTVVDVQFGAANYTPLAADFDGDSYADLTVVGPSGDWYCLLSDSRYAITGPKQFGGTGYRPIAADFDGDNRADQGVYDVLQGFWHIQFSTSGTLISRWMGAFGYDPSPADFDGDSRADLAVYQIASGYWYLWPTTSEYYYTCWFGGPSYQPIPADFDGDGIANLAVYDTITGTWFILSADGVTYYEFEFGSLGYIPAGGS